MHFISLSIFIISLLFLAVDSASGNFQPLLPPGKQGSVPDEKHNEGPGNHSGSGQHGHTRKTANPGKMFGFDGGPYAALEGKQDLFLLAQEFVAAHNWVRRRFNEPLFKWDEKLASFARQYAMHRYEDCKMVHSNGPYGENLFWGKKLHWTASDAVYYWYVENKWYDFKSLECSAPKKKGCGHFTQLVWRDSGRVGCALQHCHKKESGMLIICEYDPPGNFRRENPFVNNNEKYNPKSHT